MTNEEYRKSRGTDKSCTGKVYSCGNKIVGGELIKLQKSRVLKEYDDYVKMSNECTHCGFNFEKTIFVCPNCQRETGKAWKKNEEG